MFGVFQMTCLVPRRKIKSLRKRWKLLSRIFRTCKSKFNKSKPYCLSLARCEYIWIFTEIKILYLLTQIILKIYWRGSAY